VISALVLRSLSVIGQEPPDEFQDCGLYADRMTSVVRPSRRQLLALTLPGLVAGQNRPTPNLRVVCVGGHPDDPESGCGGTLARYSALGHTVTIIYLTRGEAGIPGKTHEEAAAIRSRECEAACKVLGARPVFAGQIDGATVVDSKTAESFARIISAESPDVVFAQWPIDTHLDHQAASTLTFRAWLSGGRRFELYYYEVNAGSQTLDFRPTDYVDITGVREKKQAALFSHKSQDGEGIYRRHHAVMEDFRGHEAGATAAEAFVHLARGTKRAAVPGLG
jgi:LmbE family N-acetylglucosaminyl deacetylase